MTAGHDEAGLLARLQEASGADQALDRLIADTFAPGEEKGDWTGSVDNAVALLHRVLPGWHWHVGWGARGVFPYAVVSGGAQHEHFEADAPTVPLALLRAMLKARLAHPEGMA